MKTVLWTAVLCCTLGTSVMLQVWIDSKRGVASAVEDVLYINSGATLKKASLGFEAITADMYWLRTIQYFGGKSLQQTKSGNVSFKDWNMNLLEPLINITTELDGKYVSAYRFGSLFLPEVDAEAAIKLAQRAIRDNPDDWRLQQDLGYIFWKLKRYQEASEAYQIGAQKKDAPAWMQQMSGVMLAKGGDRETARQIFAQIYETTDDITVKSTTLNRLKYFKAEDEINFLQKLLSDFKAQKGACPASLINLMRAVPAANLQRFQQAGMQFDNHLQPLDPDNFPYVYEAQKCAVQFAPDSTVARWKD